MSIRTKSYPNPVLGNGEDYRISIDSKVVDFEVVSKDKDNFYSTVTLNLDDDVINQLIKEEKAAFFCDIDCIKTNYRTSVWEYDKQIQLKIPRTKVVDDVDINCYIVAMKPIDGFSHPDFNEMIEGESFSLEEGDFIAVLGSFFFNATVKYSKCPAPSSLMQVQESKTINSITFNTDNERIYIVMPSDLFKLYNQVCGQNTNADDLFVSSIAVDALAYALMRTKGESTNLAENLRNLLSKNDIAEIDENQPEEYLKAARKLLEEDGVDPFTTFMRKIQAIINTSNPDQNEPSI